MTNNPQPTEITFRVYGTPATKGSWRPIGAGRGFVPDNDRDLAYWEDGVKEAAANAMRKINATSKLSGALQFEAVWYVYRPMSHHGEEFCAEKPDLDKLERAVFDGITKGGIWKDDKQVARNISEKRYVTAEENEGVKVRITVLEMK